MSTAPPPPEEWQDIEAVFADDPMRDVFRSFALILEEVCQLAESLDPAVQKALFDCFGSRETGYLFGALQDYMGLVLGVVFASGREDPPRSSDRSDQPAGARAFLPKNLENHPVYQGLDRLLHPEADAVLSPRHRELLEDFHDGGLDFAELILEEAIAAHETDRSNALDVVAEVYRLVDLELAADDAGRSRLASLQERLAGIQAGEEPSQ